MFSNLKCDEFYGEQITFGQMKISSDLVPCSIDDAPWTNGLDIRRNAQVNLVNLNSGILLSFRNAKVCKQTGGLISLCNSEGPASIKSIHDKIEPEENYGYGK